MCLLGLDEAGCVAEVRCARLGNIIHFDSSGGKGAGSFRGIDPRGVITLRRWRMLMYRGVTLVYVRMTGFVLY